MPSSSSLAVAYQESQQVVERLVEWLQAPAQASLRRAFASWLRDVLLPARLPGVRIDAVLDLSEVQNMLAERVLEWTREWKQQGLDEGRQEGRRRVARRANRWYAATPVDLEIRTTGCDDASAAGGGGQRNFAGLGRAGADGGESGGGVRGDARAVNGVAAFAAA